ncbi:MAG: sensor histidine kinase [Microbacterium sp.]|uniref:sensor histidine kinase n=1 Tax=Microbacterium sp. TaxID=51671 RepID=UPI003A84FC33
MSERPTRGYSRAWVVVAFLALVPLTAALVLDASSTGFLIAVIASGLIMVVAAWGWAIQRARRQRRDFEERLASWAAEQAIAQERLRIARDLHDLSSHGLGIITVRAAATGYLDGPDADAERQRAMLDIERIGRSSTTELRRMLTLLRTPGDDPAPRHPTDTLTALPSIIRDAERGGLIIQQSIQNLGGERHDDGGIAPSTQVAVCAVVREALTNVLRHAGPTTVRLTITRNDDAINVTVDDDGKHPGWRAEPGAGHGLTGLRERVRTHGGTLATSPTRQGFRLHASLPIEAGV